MGNTRSRRDEIFAIRNETFFDRSGVVAALENKERIVLMRLGGYVRKIMQNSFRKKKKASSPGEPPHRHIGTLRALTEFGYDKQEQSVVIGPHRIDSPTIVIGGGTVPQLLDQGGSAIVYGGESVATFLPRPFTPPAFDKGREKLAELLKTVPLKLKLKAR